MMEQLDARSVSFFHSLFTPILRNYMLKENGNVNALSVLQNGNKKDIG